jgi:signal transduction histidine kinase
MKPLLFESHDSHGLQALGRASVQVVHDLKNQINGLKLYATFLRKRMEKSERPADELETINKLLAGLDRTATDLSLIMQFGQPVEIKKQPGIDLQSMMQTIAANINEHPPTSGALKGLVVVDSDGGALVGAFDSDAISEALKSISVGAIKMFSRSQDKALIVRIERESSPEGKTGVIEWQGLEAGGHDPFNSFIGSDGLRMALAARVVEAHGGSAERQNGMLRVRLPLATQE